ncbi:hypothetical protein [Paenibacillus bovis]|uniref:Uncharacterized protein n=1 Tax=Paenibacillus bovis TaxID=1616788 RepID=A0A172ZD55_9BACL|nr:hypothetical protein [Paenibacillus bovis]ANF95586.1 hypothetical protein AR543_05920 [Paenibacillus bovis]
MDKGKKKLQKKEIIKVAMDYTSQNASSVFNFTLISVDRNDNRYPCWSVIFEMSNKQGDIVDGSLILGINEFGEIIYVG